MTKLFSMKTLAFAGAAAFALTLAAAPKADAAAVQLEYCGDLSYVEISNEDELASTKDGKVIYYQVAKTADKLKDNKYTPIADENLGYFNFSKFAGKDQVLSLSTTNGKKADATNFTIKAAPKLKAKYTAASGIELTIGTTKIATTGSIQEAVEKAGYWVEGSASYEDFVKSNLALGGTGEIYVQEILSAEAAKTTFVTYSKPAKVKISAKAKAPKVSLKLDATKAFEANLSAKQEYIIDCPDAELVGKWADGKKASWTELVKATGATDAQATQIVSGDAILADIALSVRTKAAGNKAASAINLIQLTKSAASPTTQASIETTKASNWNEKQKKYKTVTGASIKADVDIQYSVDNGEKWKVVKAGKTQKLKVDQKDVLVRIVTPAKNGVVLPSLNTKMTWDPETGKATTVSFDYDEKGAVKVLPAKNIEAK